jgi:hypothetical protein
VKIEKAEDEDGRSQYGRRPPRFPSAIQNCRGQRERRAQHTEDTAEIIGLGIWLKNPRMVHEEKTWNHP